MISSKMGLFLKCPKLNFLLSSILFKNFSYQVTVSSLYSNYITLLLEKQVNEPEESVRHILMHGLSLGRRRTDFEVNLDKKVSTKDHRRLGDMIRRRLKHEPIQYIIGEWDFMDFVFKMRPPVLICRPDTELLVEESLKILKEELDQKIIDMRESNNTHKTRQRVRIVDLGCGSGVIGVSVAKYLSSYIFERRKENEMVNHEIKLVMVDCLREAVELSIENANEILKEDQVRWEVVKCDLKENYDVKELVDKLKKEKENDQDMISITISNPPYLPSSNHKNPSPSLSSLQKELLFEDRNSLIGFFRILYLFFLWFYNRWR